MTPDELIETPAQAQHCNKLAQRDGIRCRGCEHCAPLCGEAYERGKREEREAIVAWLRDWSRKSGLPPARDLRAHERTLLRLAAQEIERGEHIAMAATAIEAGEHVKTDEVK